MTTDIFVNRNACDDTITHIYNMFINHKHDFLHFSLSNLCSLYSIQYNMYQTFCNANYSTHPNYPAQLCYKHRFLKFGLLFNASGKNNQVQEGLDGFSK